MKPYFRYQMNFTGKWIRWSLICMAISFFAMMVYCFGMTNIAQVGFVEVLFVMLLPAILSAIYVFLLKIKELNAPGIYGIIGAGLCLCALIGTFFSGSVLHVILGIIWYPICGILLLTCVGGYLPGNTPVALAFGVAIVVRLLFFMVSGFDIVHFVREISVLLCLASLMLLPLGLKAGRTKN